MRTIFTILISFTFCVFINAQITFESQMLPALEKKATIVFDAEQMDLAPNWHVVEAPEPNGGSYSFYLAQMKEDLAKKYPKKNIAGSMPRVTAEPPIVTRALWGNTNTNGTPLDNHIAVNREEQVVTVINSDITVKDSNGVTRSSKSLEAFVEELGTFSNVFDPRINYDPITDKYYMAILQGNRSSNTNIILAFTETNDATGVWHQYLLPGNPFDDGTWSDYPMITFTDTEYFLTMNSIRDDEPWETGFSQTLIYQFDKANASQGQPLEMKLWTGVALNGRNIRNLHPVKSATGEPGDNVYFLSNRNFDAVNDSIFILELNGRHDDPNTTLDIQVHLTDIPYQAPPNADQQQGFLQTNDARVLDSYLLNDQIEFVGNTMDPVNNRAAIYHGTIWDVTGERNITGNIISSAELDYGYPSLAYTGTEPGDTDAVINFSFSSATTFPSYGVLYFDNERSYSPLVTVKAGTNYIDMLNQEVERWGDYSGNQRNYADPGEVWVAASFGSTGRRNSTWLGEILKPGPDVAINEIETKIETKTFPNPTTDRFRVTIDAMDIEHMHLFLTDLNGKLIHTFIRDLPKKSGIIEFSFDTQPLPAGTYLLHIETNHQKVGTEKIVVTK